MIKLGLLLITGALVTLSSPLLAEGPDFPRGKPSDRGDDPRTKLWDSLSPEQRDKLREALRDVWIDPAVINAREEVKLATDAYQAAIKAAVSRADPSIAGVMAKIQESNSGLAHEHISGRPSMGSAGKSGFEGQIRPPGFLESVSPEMRKVTVDEMVRIDPSLAEVQVKLLGGDHGASAPAKLRKSSEPKPEVGEKRVKKNDVPSVPDGKPDQPE